MGQWSGVGAPFGAPFITMASGPAREAERPSLGPNLLDTACRVDLSVSYSKKKTATHFTRHRIRGCRKRVSGRKTPCDSVAELRGLFFIAGAAGDFQHGEESFLGNVHAADALHALLAFLLFFEEFPLSRNVSAVALCDHVFANRADRFAPNHAAADGGLDRHLEHLARDQFAETADEIVAAVVGLLAMANDRQGVHRLP